MNLRWKGEFMKFPETSNSTFTLSVIPFGLFKDQSVFQYLFTNIVGQLQMVVRFACKINNIKRGFVCLVGFLTSSSTTIADGPQDKSVWQFYVLPHMRQSWETMTSVSAGHIIQTPTQPVGSRRLQRESNPGPPHQESRALPQSYRAPPPPIKRGDEYRWH